MRYPAVISWALLSVATCHKIEISRFGLKTTSIYVNRTNSLEQSLKLGKRSDYTDTATQLVQQLYPDATFRIASDHYIGNNGVGHVNFKQTMQGIDIDNADFHVNIARDGSVFSYGHSFYSGPSLNNTLAKRDVMAPAESLRVVTKALELPINAESASANRDGEEQNAYTFTGIKGTEQDPKAHLLFFNDGGKLRLTWRVETGLETNWLQTYVDAANGDVIGVVDYSADATAYEVYPWTVTDPTDGERTQVKDPWDIKASPFTWQGDGTTNYTVTQGNNAVSETNWGDGAFHLASSDEEGNFIFPYNTSISNYKDYANASVTQLFYTVNMYHDLLYQLGFTENAGNFQRNNNGRGGLGGDYVIIYAQDNLLTDNSAFTTFPDGMASMMRIFLWDLSTPWRDAAFDAGIVIHEYTHGLSNRLTGGPANVACLSSGEPGGMGEGWGDFMAAAIRTKKSDTRDTSYGMAAWVSNSDGYRLYPYSTNETINPLTYADANSLDNRVHNIGVIWANTLYELMWNLIDEHGNTDAIAPEFDSNGVPTDGRYLTMKLVVDAMALQPCQPTFIQGRDAILDADVALTGGGNGCSIWRAFAKRGLGLGAASGEVGANTRIEDFTLPEDC